MKKAAKDILKSAVDALSHKGGIPSYLTLDDDKVEAIAKSYENEFITSAAVFEIIMDTAYSKNSAKGFDRTGFSPEDRLDICNSVIRVLDGIPYTYQFIFPLPYSSTAINYEFSKSIKIKTLTSDDITAYNPPAPKKDSGPATRESLARLLASNSTPPIYKGGDVCLMIKGTGWVSDSKIHVRCVPSDDPLFIFKVVMGVYIIKSAVKPELKEPDKWYSDNLMPYTFFVHYADGRLSARKEETPYDAKLVRENGFINEGLDDINAQIASLLTRIPAVAGKSLLTKAQRSLKIALYWYYEAKKSKQTHVKLVYMTTALDALLPELEQKERKAELISQLVTTDLITQNRLYKDIVKVYTLRNLIVHGKEPINLTYQPSGERDYTAYKGELALMFYLRKSLSNYAETFIRLAPHKPHS